MFFTNGLEDFDFVLSRMASSLEHGRHSDSFQSAFPMENINPWLQTNSSSVSIRPWGADFSALMFAIESSVENRDFIVDEISRANLSSYIVASYDAPTLQSQQFRGAIFTRDASVKADGIWEASTTSGLSGFVLQLGESTSMRFKGTGCRPRHSTAVNWYNLRQASDLKYFASRFYTLLVVGARIPITDLCSIEFTDDATDDKMRLGLELAKIVDWMYIPSTEGDRQELYINRDWRVTRKFLEMSVVINAPGFALTCMI